MPAAKQMDVHESPGAMDRIDTAHVHNEAVHSFRQYSSPDSSGIVAHAVSGGVADGAAVVGTTDGAAVVGDVGGAGPAVKTVTQCCPDRDGAVPYDTDSPPKTVALDTVGVNVAPVIGSNHRTEYAPEVWARFNLVPELTALWWYTM
jgi:hypothetical protein